MIDHLLYWLEYELCLLYEQLSIRYLAWHLNYVTHWLTYLNCQLRIANSTGDYILLHRCHRDTSRVTCGYCRWQQDRQQLLPLLLLGLLILAAVLPPLHHFSQWVFKSQPRWSCELLTARRTASQTGPSRVRPGVLLPRLEEQSQRALRACKRGRIGLSCRFSGRARAAAAAR